MENIITLDYGSGGQKTAELIDALLLPAFDNPALNELGDGACIPGNDHLVFSTDSFVVSPWKFPGGDIGKLCVCGTVNDVCMAAGIPKYLSLSFIIEEGFPVRDLENIVRSIALEARLANVTIVTGDTKVVEHGRGDGIYINTSGIGFRLTQLPGKKDFREGDAVILSGSAGCHGAAIMMARAGLNSGNLLSDCMPLNQLSAATLQAGDGKIRIMRDPTRGGVATTLTEFVENSAFSIELDENAIPIDNSVTAACDLLGLDPLYCACEGRMLVITTPQQAQAIIKAMQSLPGGRQAAVIGQVTTSRPGQVILKTSMGGRRLLTKLSGQQLPRIC